MTNISSKPIYLYNTQFPGPSTIHCSKGSLDYIYRGWEGRGRAAVHPPPDLNRPAR